MSVHHVCRCLMPAMLMALAAGCPRSTPPDVPKFTPPAERKFVDVTPEEPVAAGAPAPPPRVEPAPETPRPQPRVAAAPKPAEPPPVEKPAPPAAPTIIGRWRIVEMSHNGQSTPMPPEAQMIYEFREDGVISVSASGANIPSQEQQGTYSISGDQLTVTIQGHAQTGTFQLEGNRLTIEMSGARVIMNRI